MRAFQRRPQPPFSLGQAPVDSRFRGNGGAKTGGDGAIIVHFNLMSTHARLKRAVVARSFQISALSISLRLAILAFHPDIPAFRPVVPDFRPAIPDFYPRHSRESGNPEGGFGVEPGSAGVPPAEPRLRRGAPSS